MLYHGKDAWKAPASFNDLVEPLPADITELVPSFRYDLADLSERTDAEINGAVLTRLAQLALRWIFNRGPIERLRELIRLIERI